MPQRTCFVIMPIGAQDFPGGSITAEELKTRYDDLIREAIIDADPDMEVKRADEVALPGTVTTDIIARIMHSDIVVADVTYPNPNVFYELGLRHACRVGTVIIREKGGPQIPFDIAHMRYIEYENTPTGLKNLAEQLRQYFDHTQRNPDSPDSQFQEHAQLTQYRFPDYGSEQEDPETEVIMTLMRSPEVLELMMRNMRGEEVSQEEMMQTIFSNPEVAEPLIRSLVKSGQISLKAGGGRNVKKNQQRRRK